MERFILLMIVGLFSTLSLWAEVWGAREFSYTYEENTLKYRVLDEEQRTCEVEGFDGYYKNSISIPSVANDGNSEFIVVSIGNSAFLDCKSLTSIEIPNFITDISNNAFKGCDNLETVFFNAENIQYGSRGPYFPNTLKKVIFGDNVKNIPKSAFNGCSSLTSIDLPNSVTAIYENAFAGCSSLTSINIPNSVTYIESGAFYRCNSLTTVDIPNGVTAIHQATFSGCSSLTTINLPNSVTFIGESAFMGCALNSLIIPNSVTEIREAAFLGCTSLEELTIEDGNKTLTLGRSSIGSAPFDESPFANCPLKTLFLGRKLSYNMFSCSGIENLIINSSVVSDRAFQYCSELSTVEIGNYVSNIGNGAFNGCTNLDTVYFNAENCGTCGIWADEEDRAFPPTLKKVIFGNDVKSIPPCAFYACSSLSTIEIPNSVSLIGSGAFGRCSNVSSLTIGNSVSSIGASAFFLCSSLTTIEIPNSVSSIGASAFEACSGLKTLYFNAENCEACGAYEYYKWISAFPRTLKNLIIGNDVKSLPDNAFYGCSELTAIEISESVASIGENTFYGCVNLTTVSTPTLVNWLKIEFGNVYSNPTYYAKKLLVGNETIRRLTIPEGTTRINAFAFVNCAPLVTVTFPTSIKSVGDAPFIGCTGLQRDIFPSVESYLGVEYDCSSALITNGNNSKIYIDNEEYDPEEINWPESLTRIPAYAFFDNRTLKHINIPETVTEIGVGAFYWCSGLSEIEIPSGVTKIEDNTFNQCSSLISVKLPGSLKSIGKYSFCACRLGEIEIPSSVASIDENAFYSCYINSVKIDDIEKWCQIEFGNSASNPITYACTFSVDDKTISHLDLDLGESGVGQYAFCNAKNLETIRVKASSIGESTFNGCSNVKQICIDVDELLDYSFAGNSNLEAIYCKRENPSAASDNTFSKYEGVILYVPEGAVSRYENAETCWWRFLDVKETNFSNLDEIFSPDLSSIDNIFVTDENKSDGPMEIYSINGVKIGNSTSNLPAGIYIVRQGNTVKKVAVK